MSERKSTCYHLAKRLPSYSERYNKLFELIMDAEDAPRSGKQTKDLGGVTQWGIALGPKGNFVKDPVVKAKILSGTLSLDEAKAYYHQRFYTPFDLDSLDYSDAVAYLLFDIAVGPNRAFDRTLQEILIEMGKPVGKADGLVGRRTRAAMRKLTEAEEQYLFTELGNRAVERGATHTDKLYKNKTGQGLYNGAYRRYAMRVDNLYALA